MRTKGSLRWHQRPIETYDVCSALLSQLRLSVKRNWPVCGGGPGKGGGCIPQPHHPSCVVFARKLIEKLRTEYDKALHQPTIFSLLKPGQAMTSSGDWLSEITEWSPVSHLKISATAPEFVTVKGGDVPLKSELTLARLLRRSHPPSRYHILLPDEKIRLQKLAVLWSAAVDPDNAEFSDTNIDEVQPTFGDDFVEATWELRSSLGFPLIQGLDPE